ncbi:hypothetical protein CROQUDRAFT_653892 [Cronartium quercuum f. sp. fusiforme G11]|uniref:Protein BZZ1 n=1 Tax=Cronartium quercuum f. sp. fusiforme G11 TaxID=708437 RepID=A0A9P6TEA9_9BASI|nr:hypothetical protein CROQUDRAFT_653892 [Cronartium quercuum f. sp. fusiforme G11]
MDVAPPSFGRQLNDQLPRIQTIVQDHIGFLGDVREYLKERVALERHYGSSLQGIVKKAMEKRIKKEQAMAIGTEPSKPWSGSSSTLDAAWSRILSEADEEATDHTNLADSIQNQICEVLKAAERKKESTRKKHMEFAAKILSERDKIYNEKMKAKQRYDEACGAVESTRVKQGQAKDERHVEKAAKNMDSSTNEMMSCKNNYILALHVANEAKNRFYQVDLPSLGDDFQSLWSLTTFKLVSILKKIAELNGSYLDAQRSHNEHVLDASTTIDAISDQRLFIEFNYRPFVEPPDFVFEPCPIWHDTSEFALSAPEPKTLLQNKLVQSRSKADELQLLIEAKRNEISGLEKLREAYAHNESLGDPDEVVDNLLESVRQTITLEMQYTVLRKEIEVLEETLGDDQGSQRPHKFKTASFVTPTPCHVCKSNIWGLTKQGVTCKACSIHAHVKCGPKVPADCSGTAPQRNSRSRQSMGGFSGATLGTDTNIGRASSMVRNPSAAGTGLTRSATTAGSGATSASRRGVPSRRQVTRAKMLYGHEASTPFEVNVPESAIVTVITPDDGSGWIKVETQDKRQGLVPASYVEFINLDSTESEAPVIPPRMKQAKVLFDWTAQAPDEHSITVGEIVNLTEGGETYGEGWYEITKSGRKGIIPSNYVTML